MGSGDEKRKQASCRLKSDNSYIVDAEIWEVENEWRKNEF